MKTPWTLLPLLATMACAPGPTTTGPTPGALTSLSSPAPHAEVESLQVEVEGAEAMAVELVIGAPDDRGERLVYVGFRNPGDDVWYGPELRLELEGANGRFEASVLGLGERHGFAVRPGDMAHDIVRVKDPGARVRARLEAVNLKPWPFPLDVEHVRTTVIDTPSGSAVEVEVCRLDGESLPVVTELLVRDHAGVPVALPLQAPASLPDGTGCVVSRHDGVTVPPGGEVLGLPY